MTIENYKLYSVLLILVCFSGIRLEAQITTGKEIIKKRDQIFNQTNSQKRSSNSENILPLKKTIRLDNFGMPKGANPFTSNSPNLGSAVEWSQYMRQFSKKYYSKSRTEKNKNVFIKEDESPLESTNDLPANAQPIPNFGSGKENINKVTIQGFAFGDPIDKEAFNVTNLSIREDDVLDNGIVSTATALKPFDQPFSTIQIDGSIGDGPNGSLGTGFGDYDVYRLDMKAGQTIYLKANPKDPNSEFNPVVGVFENFFGSLLPGATNFIPQFSLANGFPFRYTAPVDDTYYIVVADYQSFVQIERPTPTSFIVDIRIDIQEFDGNLRRIGEEGDYSLVVTDITDVDQNPDSDFFSINLKKGDVLGLATNGSPLFVELVNEDLTGSVGSIFRLPFQPIEESPLPDDGDITLSYIAPEDGKYTFRVIGLVDEYKIDAVVSRPGFEINSGEPQIIYLSFTENSQNLFPFVPFFEDPFVDPRDIPILQEPVTLSAFEEFLPNWGIENNIFKRTQLAAGITSVVQENIDTDLKKSGINPDFNVIIVSDYGLPSLGKRIPQILENANIPYSKVIIGGTIDESTIETIGIANHIDVGNYSSDDIALVLLDLLSLDDSGSAFYNNSINSIELAEGISKEEAIIRTVGNITSHEIGHFVGNFHTEAFNDTPSIMDQGGRDISFAAGVAENGVFGDENTIDVDFSTDAYSASEFFSTSDFNFTKVNTAYAFGFSIGLKNDDDTLTQIKDLETFALSQLDNIISKNYIKSYPNPVSTHEISKLSFPLQKSGKVLVSIHNIQGRKIQTVFDGFMDKGNNKKVDIILNDLSLTSGLYMYKIQTADKSFTHKFMIR